jgi:hemoglobin
MTHYERIGGEKKIRELVDRFYDLMDTLPEVKEIRDWHGKDLTRARQLLFDFLSGWLGGPQLYVEKYGHPRLRQRHMLVAIRIKERDQWLHCMYQAMKDVGVEEDLQKTLRDSFFKVADHMRNEPEAATT